MRTVILGLALLATPVAAAEQQFDLVCTAKKETVRYRIDLASGEWCEGACGEVEKIAGFTSGVITLSETTPAPPRNVTAYRRVNRATGAWEWFYDQPSFTTAQDIRGNCEAAAFSGFPAKKF